MAVNNNEFANVETEIVKGEQDDVLKEYPQLKKDRIQKPHSKALVLKSIKHDIPQVTAKSASLRIEELARPTKQRVLNTLKEKVPILSPAFVNNLIKIIEAESCLTPEEAAHALRWKKREKKKLAQFPSLMRKWRKKITEDIAYTTMLDKDAAMCQYLMAEHFIKSIFGHQCQTPKKDIREITAVIFKHLTSLNRYITNVQNDDRATQQLRFLANTVACWIAEILIEVAETHKETLEEYFKKRQMKMIEVNDHEINSENEDWKQIDQEKEKKEEKDENVEDVENVENVEDVKNVENVEDVENVENVEDKVREQDLETE